MPTNCIIIEAVIYGFIPTAATEKRIKVPPEKIFNNVKKSLPSKIDWILFTSAIATGMLAITLKAKIINAVKNNFLRRASFEKTL